MTTNPARPLSSAHRPPSGAPWWIWLVIGGFGLAVAGMLLSRLTPEDGAAIYAEALAAGEVGNREILQQKLQQLQEFPAYSAHSQFLEGMLFLSRSMPLKAIPLFKQAAESPELRPRALLNLGRAYGTSGQLEPAISTLELIMEDEQFGNQARYIAAGMLATAQAWDYAITNLKALQAAGFQKANVLHQLAEIEFDRGNYPEAETLFQAAIEEFPTDPANSLKASRLLDCRLQLGNLRDSDKFIEMIDNQISASLFRAENLRAAGKFKEARTTLERGMREAEGSPILAFQLGKLALAEKNIDAAKLSVNEVLAACTRFPRSIEGLKILLQLAEFTNDSDLADKSRQNLEKVEAVRSQMLELIPAVSSSLSDVQSRLQLADLARECGNAELMQKVFRGLTLFHPELEGQLTQKRQEMDANPEIFVPFGREVTLPTNRGRIPENPQSSPSTEQPPAAQPAAEQPAAAAQTDPNN